MDSSVTAIILASLLASVSSQWLNGCPLVDSFCDPEDAQYDLGTLTGDNLLPTATAADAAEECYNLCNAESAVDSVPRCEDFTVMKVGNRPPKCYLLREACMTNIVDDCIAKGNCISGPNDCSEVPQTCPVVASLPEGFSRWQCVDINMEPINPYTVEPPVGTICYQTCPSWTDSLGNPARLVSECQEGASAGAWSPAQSVDNAELSYPPYPADGVFDSSYPTPDHYVATAKCQNGEWLGNPEWGFWCYEEPTELAGGDVTDAPTPPAVL